MPRLNDHLGVVAFSVVSTLLATACSAQSIDRPHVWPTGQDYPTPPIDAAAATVTSFGAVCDGSADDTNAIQDGLSSIRHGGQLVFPPGGTCVITDSLTLHGGAGWTIIGQNATIKMDDSVVGTGKPGAWILSTRDNEDFAIYDLILDGNRQGRDMPGPKSGAQNQAHDLSIFEGRDFKVVRTHFINSVMDGVMVAANNQNPTDPARASRRGVFHDILADNNWRIGLFIANAEDVLIENSTFTNSNGDWPQSGIDIEPNEGTYEPAVRNITIRNNTIAGNNGWGIQLVGKGSPENYIIENNYLADNARGGIDVGAKDVTIRSNLFENYHRFVDELAYGKRRIVMRGIIGIRGVGAANVVIENNTFRSIDVGAAVLEVRTNAGSGHRFDDNCIHDVTIEPMDDPANKTTAARNRSDGEPCPDPRGR